MAGLKEGPQRALVAMQPLELVDSRGGRQGLCALYLYEKMGVGDK